MIDIKESGLELFNGYVVNLEYSVNLTYDFKSYEYLSSALTYTYIHSKQWGE